MEVFLINKKVVLLSAVVVLCIAAGVIAFSLNSSHIPTNNTTNMSVNSSTTTNTPNETVKITKIVATQSGPAKAQQGTNITINYSIANTGNQAVYNVKALDQSFTTNIGTLKPGQTKSYSYTLYIPTNKEVQEDFDPNATVSNPFFIGGFSVTYTESNGSKHTLNANSLEIKLV